MVIQRVGSMPPTSQEVLQLGSMPPMSKEVLYIGSSVPLETSTGLEAIQQPLRSRYPVDDDDIQGIPSILTVMHNGIQLKYLDDPSHVIFFPYTALNMCAAVRCVSTTNTATHEVVNRFVSLTESPKSDRPAIFTTITRRTQGRCVLECSGFLTKIPSDALDLVQWTFAADKRSKTNGGFVSMGGAVSPFATANSAVDVSKQDISFQAENNTPETPVNIVASSDFGQAAVKVASYNELPKDGYFYTTENAQVRKFSLHKFVQQSQPPPPPPPPPQLPVPQPPSVQIQPAAQVQQFHAPILEPAPTHVSQTVEEHMRSAHIVNGDQFDRRSTYSMPATRSTKFVAVRGPPPGAPMIMGPRPHLMAHPPRPPVMMVRPPPPRMVMMRPPFLPMHPAMSRRGPVPMMMPVPMAYPPGTLPRQTPHRRSSSSESSSSSSSDSHGGRKKRNQIVRRDHSFDSYSRPITPPTDYDLPPNRRYHSSRKDEYYMRQMNGFGGGAMPMMVPRGRGYPPGYNMMIPSHPNAMYGPPTLIRAKSVPPHAMKISKKDKKSKKKSKKEKKLHNKYGDLSPGSDGGGAGYNSDIGPGGIGMSTYARPWDQTNNFARSGLFRDSRTSNNIRASQHGGNEMSFSKNAAERAFSSSLAAETRNSTRGAFNNAYSINRQNGVGDADFPILF